MLYRLLLIPLLLFAFAAPAAVQVYKCQNGDGVVYSDAPCKSGAQTVTDIQTRIPATASAGPSLTQRMDEAVRSAIAAGELQRARALATTAQHQAWIAAAQRERTIAFGRTEADLSAERGDSQACQQAIRSLELEASSPFDEPEALDAKRSIMRAACGIREPVEINHQEAPATVLYPVPRRPYYRPGFPHPHRPGWQGQPRPPVKERPAVSVIVGPADD